jgi:hypothetical protein
MEFSASTVEPWGRSHASTCSGRSGTMHRSCARRASSRRSQALVPSAAQSHWLQRNTGHDVQDHRAERGFGAASEARDKSENREAARNPSVDKLPRHHSAGAQPSEDSVLALALLSCNSCAPPWAGDRLNPRVSRDPAAGLLQDGPCSQLIAVRRDRPLHLGRIRQGRGSPGTAAWPSHRKYCSMVHNHCSYGHTS